MTRVRIGTLDGTGARIDAQIGAHDDPDVTIQLPLRTITGKVVGAFQVAGWAWTSSIDGERERDVHYAVALLGPRGGRQGTSVRLGRGEMQGLAVALRIAADHADRGETHVFPIGFGFEGQERILVNVAHAGDGLGGRLWTEGARGKRSKPLLAIHPEDLDQCAGLVRLVEEVIAP